MHNACQANPKTHCPVTLLKNLVANQQLPQVGTHFRCMAEGLHLLEHGHLNLNVIKQKISAGSPRHANVDVLLHKCANFVHTPELTAVKLFICFVQNDIHYYLPSL